MFKAILPAENDDIGTTSGRHCDDTATTSRRHPDDIRTPSSGSGRAGLLRRHSRQIDAEDIGQEFHAFADAVVVEPMAKTGAGVMTDGNADGFETGDRIGQGRDRHHIVGVAMRQKHRRARLNGVGQQFQAHQHAGIAEDSGHRIGAPEAHMQRHHGALGKTDQRQLVLAQPRPRQLRIDEGIEDRGRRLRPGEARFGGHVLKRKPLMPLRRHVEGERRMGRNEQGIGENFLEIRGKTDQVVAVRTDAVQHDEQLLRVAAGERRQGRAGKGGRFVHSGPHHSVIIGKFGKLSGNRKSMVLSRPLATPRNNAFSDPRRPAAIMSSNRPTITRFAPSPTGFLHLGHAYSALFTAERAHAAGGRFLLRIEDIDTSRVKPEFDAAITEDMAWLGLEWEEPVRRQSEHFDDYSRALEQLEDRGLVYPCFCTRREIRAEIRNSGAAPHDGPPGSEGPLYPGTCRRLTDSERQNRRDQDHPFALRLDSAKATEITGPLIWSDAELGDIEASLDRLGDVVLGRKETPASYHLAVTIDDHLQGVSLVTRGEDLFSSTHVHRVLQALLGLDTPAYHHHRLLTGADGQRFAKRDKSLTIRALREDGNTASQVRAMAGFGDENGDAP